MTRATLSNTSPFHLIVVDRSLALGLSLTTRRSIGPMIPSITRQLRTSSSVAPEAAAYRSSSKVRKFLQENGLLTTFFQTVGVALYLYGAPKAALDAISGGDYPHGHQEVCINRKCHSIDSHQAYLNLDEASEHHPVLLWANERLSPLVRTSVTFKLVEPENMIGRPRGMSFERVIYTELQPARCGLRLTATYRPVADLNKPERLIPNFLGRK